MSKKKNNAPEWLINRCTNTIWIRTDIMPDIFDLTDKEINEKAQEYVGDEDKFYICIDMSFMRPLTPEECEMIGEEDYWEECEKNHPDAVTYWSLIPFEYEGFGLDGEE